MTGSPASATAPVIPPSSFSRRRKSTVARAPRFPLVIRGALLLFVVLLVGSWAPGLARAQARVDVSARLSTDVVEVDQGFHVELSAEVEDGPMPDSPQLEVPPNFSASGPNVSKTGMRIQIGVGPMTMKRTYSARWYLVPSKPGTFRIPAPTVTVGGQRVRAVGQLEIKVMPAGQGPPAQPRQRRPSAFGGFGSFFGPSYPFDFNDDPFQEETVEPDELEPRARDLMLPREPDSHVFLRLIPDKEKAVVGEQITLGYYVYYRADMKLTDQREPPLSDFLRMDLDRASAAGDPIITSVGRWRYHVKLLDRVAIFPLHVGKLSTGKLTGRFEGRAFGNRELDRESNDVVIDVRQPPKEGRPVGYRLGDVGRFALRAEVEPRLTTVGETVAVRVRVTGRGQLPSQLDLPQRTGVEWLEPEKREELTIQNGRIGGWRSFGYAVRFREQGEVPLGSIELSYWDPERRQYETASVDLGNVLVQKGDAKAAPVASSDVDDRDPFASLAKPRTEIGVYTPPGDEGFEPRYLWALVLVGPLGVAFSQLGLRAAGHVRRRRRERKNDPATLAARALVDVKRAEGGKDAAAAAERAVHLAVEAATGIKSRGVLLAELGVRLEDEGIEEDVARQVVELLEHCSAVRFEPSDDQAVTADLRKRAGAVVKALGRRHG